jgi:hypothetical protein
MRLLPRIEEILLCPISTILERSPGAQAQQLAAPPTLGIGQPLRSLVSVRAQAICRDVTWLLQSCFYIFFDMKNEGTLFVGV